MSAKALIEHLELAPHPEGGWFRETWRAHASKGQRAGGTAIHFLFERGQCSHWHTVDAAEIWLWHAGDPLLLSLAGRDTGLCERYASARMCWQATGCSMSSLPESGKRRPPRRTAEPDTRW
jgi:predicted cupin superfamily sugar epimerase